MSQTYMPTANAWREAYGIVPHKITMLRAIRRGLHAVKIGNRWHTTVESVKEYTEAISATDRDNSSFAPKPKAGRRSDAQRAKDIAKAAKELEQAGI